MEELITVVVPVYNVEKYLENWIESILNQTYKKLQIILVDDGSTDNCPNICDKLSRKDKRIEVIHKINGGLSDARNKGIEKAKGKFICFIDSDDFINYKFIEKLYKLIKKYDADISMTEFEKINELDNNYMIDDNGVIQEKIYTGKQMIENIYNKKLYVPTIVTWNKLYKIELFRDIRFPYGKINEDEYTTYKVFYNSNKIVTTSEKLYYYRIVSTSIMHKQYSEKRLNIIYAVEERLEFLKNRNEDKLYNLSLIWYLTLIMIHYENCKKYIKKSKNIQKMLINKYKANYKKALELQECTKQDKIKIILFKISPFLYYNTRKFAKFITKE